MSDMSNARADVRTAKGELRRGALARRRLTTPDERRGAGEALAAAARRAGLTGASPVVAAYVSMGTEIDMTPLLRAFLDAGRRVLVPRLGRGLDVGWSVLETLDDLTSAGERRPDEPMRAATLGPEALRDAGLVLVPALGVDARGTRLGRGGGWYDRALAFRAPSALVAAVCWPWETLGAGGGTLPCEAHDLPVDAVLTPDGFRRVGRARTA
ncbi:5-formyltetrahydrofolate cyclo-ligase [Bifidobacterium moraviense]